MATLVAMNSAEAEYMSACTACMTIAHLRMLAYNMMNLGHQDYDFNKTVKLQTPTIVLVDNSSAVQMASNTKQTRQNRHIQRRFHYVRQGQRDGKHKITWICKEDQLADIMTKTQDASKIDPQFTRIMYKLPKHLCE